jgi:hypothetical protein
MGFIKATHGTLATNALSAPMANSFELPHDFAFVSKHVPIGDAKGVCLGAELSILVAVEKHLVQIEVMCPIVGQKLLDKDNI